MARDIGGPAATAANQHLFSKGYGFAYTVLLSNPSSVALHKTLALDLAIEAWDYTAQPAKVQAKRWRTRVWRGARQQQAQPQAPLKGPYKLLLAASDLYLQTLGTKTQAWAQEQEEWPQPSTDNTHRPSSSDMLPRYVTWLNCQPDGQALLRRWVTWLLWKTMAGRPAHRALALGSLLYSYSPDEVRAFTYGAWPTDNFGRIKRTLLRGAKERFRNLTTSPSPPQQEERIDSRAPRGPEQQVIEKILAEFTSWRPLTGQPPHPVAPAEVLSLFGAHSPTPDEESWEQQNHGLACPVCGSIPQLVRASMTPPANPPQDPPRIPSFVDAPPQGNAPPAGPAPPDPFSPPPLEAADWERIQAALDERQSRRQAHRGRVLRVLVDGAERLRFNLAQTPRGALNITDDDTYIEVFGRDEHGDLLLAVFPIPELRTLRGPREFYVTPDGEQRISLRVSHIQGDDSETPRGLAELTYAETRPVTAAVLLWERWRFWWERWQQAEIFRVPVAWVAPALLVLLLTGATYAVSEFTTLLSQYNTLVERLNFDKPFAAHFSAVGQRSLELNLSLHTDVVREVFVDWGDPSHPDPVGGTRIYPGEGVEVGQGKLRLPPITHEYGPVSREGLRTTARVHIVPTALPKVRPEPLREANLHPSRRLWVLPYGVVLDPPEAELRIVSPPAGEIVTPTTEVQIRAGALTADIHLLALDPAHPEVYQYLGKLPPLPFGQESTLTRVIDTSQLQAAGPFRLVALSSEQLTARVGDRVEWRDIPQTAPRTEVEVRHAGIIVSPRPGAVVSGIDTVRAQVFLANTYVAAVLCPAQAGACVVQNTGQPVVPFVEFSRKVFYAGKDTYELFLGITYDPELFKEGAPLAQRPLTDREGRRVYWVGPVQVEEQ